MAIGVRADCVARPGKLLDFTRGQMTDGADPRSRDEEDAAQPGRAQRCCRCLVPGCRVVERQHDARPGGVWLESGDDCSRRAFDVSEEATERRPGEVVVA